jgi:signal transduction histidine kinase
VTEPVPPDRFEQVVVTNLRTDVIAQVIIATLAFIVSPAGWVWAVWDVRWFVVGGIALSLHALRRDRRDRALHVLCGAHLIGAMLTVAILPEGILLGLLVVLSDLVLIARFGSPKRQQMYWWIGALVAGALSLLSLQSWTRFGQTIPETLLVVGLMIHVAITSWIVAGMTRRNAELLSDRAEQLERLRGRLVRAGDDERVRIEAALRVGPLADLEVLAAHIDDLTAALDQSDHEVGREARRSPEAVAGEAATAAQSSLRSLRSLCHDISPQQLRQNGLAAATATLAGRAASIECLVVPPGRLDVQVESVLYAAVVELVTASHATGTPLRVEITADADAAIANLSLSTQTWQVSSSVDDRVTALGGSTNQIAPDSIVIKIPIGQSPEFDPDETRRQFTSSVQEHPVLKQFIDSSFVFATVGMIAVCGVWLATRKHNVAALAAVLVAVFTLLGLARSQLRKHHVGAALALVCVETSGAAVAMALLIPESISASAMTAVVPMALAVALADRTVLFVIAALQTAFSLVIAALGVLRSPLLAAHSVPTAVAVIAIPLAVAGITLLGVTTSARTLNVLNDQRAAIAASVRRLVRARDDEGVRIERDLHDGAQQHLVSLSIQLRALAGIVGRDLPKARRLAADLRQQVTDASAAMSSLIAGTYPAQLAAGNLTGAVRAMAERQTPPVTFSADGAEHLDMHLATTAYFACVEALQNAAKHAGPLASVHVHVRELPDRLVVEVRDDGRGFDVAAVERARGLHHLRDRWEAVGGTVVVRSQPGSGTTVTATVPTRATTT